MKKILLLGGSPQQIVAIESAKKMGYKTILCDYLPDNPGKDYADTFYQISTTDLEAVLNVARKEEIDGIIAYASDPAAPTAAYVAEKLNLPTNPYKSVDILCNKDKFRKFLKNNEFNTPVSYGYVSKEAALEDKDRYRLPVIIKPVDSSGSKGVTVLQNWDDLEKAVDFAFSFSRSNRIIIEEYIEKNHKYLIGGDIFVIGGKIVLWGLLNCHRDNNVNSLVPVGKSYPLMLDEEDICAVRQTLQKMVDKLQMKNGAMNVELVVDKNHCVWPIDIGPRNGGNMIPDLLGYIFDVDMVEMSIKAAMGDEVDVNIHDKDVFFSTYNLHSCKDGIYKDIRFSEKVEPYIIKKCLYKQQGNEVQYFDNASKALGIVFMKFDAFETMIEVMDGFEKYVDIELE